MNRLPALGLLLLLSACSVTYVPPSKGIPAITEPSLPPSAPASKGEAAGNVACPTTASAGAAYTGFGAAAADFNAGHEGQNLLVRCSTDLRVIVLQLEISPATDVANALALARGQLPNDLKPVYDETAPTCRDLQFQSATLRSILGVDDPDGVVNIELESALAPNFAYTDKKVDTALIHQQYNLGETQPCIR